LNTKEDNKIGSITFTDFLRKKLGKALNLLAIYLNNTGLSPNVVTISGLLGNIIASVLLAQGFIQIGGVIVLLVGFTDAFDGAMARARGTINPFGAFLDSVMDRYSEMFLFGGLLINYLNKADYYSILLVYLAAIGSFLVSYTRARGQSLGIDVKSGILTRLERFLILSLSLLFNLPYIGILIIAIFANFTAIQRIIEFKDRSSNDRS
jgi:CDP-diacylglycerol--glycerol-3-phosphate 3-phosphatidyltransferase